MKRFWEVSAAATYTIPLAELTGNADLTGWVAVAAAVTLIGMVFMWRRIRLN